MARTMVAISRYPFAVSVVLGLLIGSGVGAVAFGAHVAQLRIENHELRGQLGTVHENGVFTPEGRAYPDTIEAARDAGYAPVFWGRCDPGAGYHYDKPVPSYEGPHLLFAADDTFLGYKFQVDARIDLDGPWQRSTGHPGAQYAHWDLYVFVRDPAGACRA